MGSVEDVEGESVFALVDASDASLLGAGVVDVMLETARSVRMYIPESERLKGPRR